MQNNFDMPESYTSESAISERTTPTSLFESAYKDLKTNDFNQLFQSIAQSTESSLPKLDVIDASFGTSDVPGVDPTESAMGAPKDSQMVDDDASNTADDSCGSRRRPPGCNDKWDYARTKATQAELLLKSHDLVGLHKLLKEQYPQTAEAMRKVLSARLGMDITVDGDSLSIVMPRQSEGDTTQETLTLEFKDGKVEAAIRETKVSEALPTKYEAIPPSDAIKKIAEIAKLKGSADPSILDAMEDQVKDLMKDEDYAGLTELADKFFDKDDKALAKLHKHLSSEYGLKFEFGKRKMEVTFTPEGNDSISKTVTLNFDANGKLIGGDERSHGGYSGGDHSTKELDVKQALKAVQDLRQKGVAKLTRKP